ncbi:MAG: hypothetical protein GEV13_20990 [Rhodospirillales bacterium]|nr:hypothetical protein [Rhodospirillales bacterium]
MKTKGCTTRIRACGSRAGHGAPAARVLGIGGRLAEAAGFDVFVTTDRNIRYQQNLTGRRIAVVVPGRGRWRLIKNKLREIAAAIATVAPGGFTKVEIPVG